MAATAPSTIEAMAIKVMTCCHWSVIPPNGPIMVRRIRQTAATFGATANKAVTGVGAPS